jgi:hypothetical protein
MDKSLPNKEKITLDALFIPLTKKREMGKIFPVLEHLF